MRDIPVHEKVLTPAEVAEMFRVDAKTVARWARSRKLRTVFRTIGGQRRYSESEVRAMLRDGRT
jgi:excisionase family DNA binding protein